MEVAALRDAGDPPLPAPGHCTFRAPRPSIRSVTGGRRNGLQPDLHRATGLDRRTPSAAGRRICSSPPRASDPRRVSCARPARGRSAAAARSSCPAATGPASSASTASGVASPKRSVRPRGTASTCRSDGSPGTRRATGRRSSRASRASPERSGRRSIPPLLARLSAVEPLLPRSSLGRPFGPGLDRLRRTGSSGGMRPPPYLVRR